MRATLLGLLGLLACCAAPLPPAMAGATPPQASRPHLWYVGLALYDETWSENDVTEAAALLGRRVEGYQIAPTILSNHGSGREPRYAPADPAAIRAALSQVARQVGPQDLVMIYASTHGAPGLLGRSEGGAERAPISVGELRAWLTPLGRQPTVIVLSACFSGSFIPALQADNRIILTAARADRTSFGCQAGAEHTVFGAAFLDALQPPHESWRTIVERARAEVTTAETRLAVRDPSQPQLAVGHSVRTLFDQPQF